MIQYVSNDFKHIIDIIYNIYSYIIYHISGYFGFLKNPVGFIGFLWVIKKPNGFVSSFARKIGKNGVLSIYRISGGRMHHSTPNLYTKTIEKLYKKYRNGYSIFSKNPR